MSAPPSAPQNLHVVSADGDRVTLAWDAPPDAVDDAGPVRNYIVEMYSLEDAEFIEKFPVDGTTRSYTATGLQTAGPGYVFSVRAENDAGVSENAAELDGPVLAGLCPFVCSVCSLRFNLVRRFSIPELYAHKSFTYVVFDRPSVCCYVVNVLSRGETVHQVYEPSVYESNTKSPFRHVWASGSCRQCPELNCTTE